MNCTDAEILLAEYLEGALDPKDRADQKLAVENHLAECPSCKQLAEDAAGAVSFLERVADVQAPPEVINRILFEIPHRAEINRSFFKKLVREWLRPVFQPRFAMGMAMTMLSFGMVFRFAGIHQLKPADLNPSQVWVKTEDHVARLWDRGNKYYQNLRVVFEVRSRLNEWAEYQAQTPDPAQMQGTTQGTR